MLRLLYLGLALLLFAPLHAQVTYPDYIYADTAFAPFYYGVASGDPLQDRVIIWTKVAVVDTNQLSVPLRWEVMEDSVGHHIIDVGQTAALKKHDYTVKVDVTGLLPGHQYFYRFYFDGGPTSRIGICRTLPSDSVTHFKLAIVSCSSVWSGYFNAYRRIAERSDIDFVVHLGDYAYDFVDNEEERRMPTPYPIRAKTRDDWRERNTYYLLDPDLRAARQDKTWISEWDNHDNHGVREEAEQVFYEYQPIRMPDTLHPERIYRQFHFGTLADLDMIDMYLFRGREQHASGVKSILGLRQDAWLRDQLLQSRATWRLIGNQEMMGSWMSEGLPKFLHLPGDGRYFDQSSWDGYPEDRARFYDFLDSSHINNIVVVTGDAHMSFIIDLAKNPKDKASFHKRSGEGAVGVEMLGPSITRGNMSDRKKVPKGTIPLIQSISKSVNPHHRWVNFAKHGYCTLDVTPERCIGEFWYSPILIRSGKEKFGAGFTVRNGTNHWERKMNRNVKRSTHPKQKSQ